MSNINEYSRTKWVRIRFVSRNHAIILEDNSNSSCFQSYNSIVAKCEHGKYTLGIHWNYSATTIRNLLQHYIPSTIATNKKELQQAIDDGTVLFDSNLI